MLKNEIYYSLSKYEIQAIEQQIKSNSSSTYLDIVVSFKRHEIDKMYHLLSNLYLYENKEHIQNQIWETFLCNKILNEIEKQELIYFSHNLNEEMKVLTSFSINDFINLKEKRSSISLLNQIVEMQISKKVRIHYFQEDTILPIGLQKTLNLFFVTPLSFANMLYTTRNSLNSYYMHTGYWVKYEKYNLEIWNLLHSHETKANY